MTLSRSGAGDVGAGRPIAVAVVVVAAGSAAGSLMSLPEVQTTKSNIKITRASPNHTHRRRRRRRSSSTTLAAAIDAPPAGESDLSSVNSRPLSTAQWTVPIALGRVPFTSQR